MALVGVASVVDKKAEGGGEILRRKAKGGEQVMESSLEKQKLLN